jgi:hypothetical protein
MLFLKDPAKVSTLQRLEADKVHTSDAVGMKLSMTLLVGFGVFIATANPLFGAVAGAFPALSMMRGLKRGAERKQFYRRSGGALAHLLDEAELVQLVKQVGLEEVKRQLCVAIEHGQELTDDAEDLANQIIEKRPATTIAEMLAELDELPLSQDELLEEDSIEVSAETVIESSTATASTASATPAQSNRPPSLRPDIAETILAQLRCLFVTAPPRVGKGIVMLYIQATLKEAYPKSTLLTCTIKQFEGENWYWQYSDGHINPDITSSWISHQDKVRAARLAYAQYQHWESLKATPDEPAILLIDELRDHLNGLADVKMSEVSTDFIGGPIAKQSFSQWFFNNAISAATLNQCHFRFIWLISPVMSLGGLGGIKGVTVDSLASYSGLTLVTPDRLQFATGGGSAFAAPKISADDVQFEGYHGLAWAKDSKQWLPLPIIPQADIDRMAANPPKLKMFGEIVPAEEPEARTIGPIENPELLSLLIWLKRSGRTTLTAESLRNSHWAKKADARSTARVQNILTCAVEAGLLLEKADGEFAVVVKMDEIGDLGKEVCQGHP